MKRRVIVLAGIAALSGAACAGSRSASSASGPATFAPPAQRLLDGVYAVCAGAYAHNESLVLRDGTWQHFIQTHGVYGSRSAGTYSMLGDTLVLTVTREGPVPQGVQIPIGRSYDFVVGEYAGLRVLWRGAAAAQAAAANPGAMSEYAALLYSGPDSNGRQVPSCGELRRRLRGGRL